MQFHIENMTCGGCVRGVTRAIQAEDSKAVVRADLDSQRVEVTTSATRGRLVAALEEAGFMAV